MRITRATSPRVHSLFLALLGVVAVIALSASPAQAGVLDRQALALPAVPSSDRLPNDWGAGRIRPDISDVAYDATHPDEAHRADVYLPRGGGNRGVMIVVHGGGFTTGNRTDVHRFLGPLLRQLDRGLAVVTISYRFDAFPAAVLDVDAAVRFVRGPQGAALGLNPSSVLVAGHSAGGAITADMALAGDRGDIAPYGELSPVDGWITVSAPLDLDAPIAWGQPARDAWRAGSEPAASPLANLSEGDPPGLMIHGDDDPIVPAEHAHRMQARALAIGTDAPALDLVTDAPQSCRGHAPMCGASVSELDRFVDRIVSRPR